MKHPRFEFLGKDYPYALEEKFDRILIKIDELWGTLHLEDYFSDLIIDRRGGRQGFPQDVLDDILMLRQTYRIESIRKADDQKRALAELKKREIPFETEAFLDAVANGETELVDLFVQGGIHIHVVDKKGSPPLMTALKQGYTIIASILMHAGADVNEYDRMGETPLLIACGKKTDGYKSLAEKIIMKGAYINERDHNGFTPLMLSLTARTNEISALLIERGANIHLDTRDGITPLSIAKGGNNQEMVELLIEKGAGE